MAKTEPIQVALGDGDPGNYRVLEELLQSEPAVKLAGYAPEETGLRSLIELTRPDVVLLDILLSPEPERYEFLKWIKKEFPGLKSVMMTAGITNVADCYRHGAEGYLLKGQWEDVVPCIINVHNGETVVPNTVAKHLVEQLQENAKRLELENELNIYTERELQILTLIKAGLSSAAIAVRINISPYTLKRHVQNIRKKSNGHSVEELLEKFREVL